MNLFKIVLMIATFFIISINTNAGVYVDGLSKCLVNSESKKDKIVLLKGYFAAFSVHPAIQSMSSVSKIQSEKISKDIAILFTKLFTKSCKNEIKKVMKYEGEFAVLKSLNFFGGVAIRELYSNPEVEKKLSNLLTKNFDSDKFNHLLK